ncbi:hypothetical protein DOTSEDRAFT_82604 [Dothistroma septosporum NZE10]|uniref:Uncharacterized protein n=1 Tax=Dothistroma septosporum (strain NZE10 / CBS 128990) TaxID=675120 RepID=N1PE04_DOTSN|nr:hypothetical protein DOTSEDRAFT_82604 [Dothistroma septosporum NZE10]
MSNNSGATDKAKDFGQESKQAGRELGQEASDFASDVSQTARKYGNQAGQTAKEFGHEAKKDAKEAGRKVEQEAKEAKDTFVAKLKEDGVVNPAGLALIGFGGLFLAAVPVTSWIAQQGGLVEKAVNGVISTVGFLGSAGQISKIPQTGKIAALAGLYVTVTYALTGAGSAAGKAASSEKGLDSKHPRSQVANLKGLPLRLHSAHYNLMEMFPGWAVTAALAQAMAPGDQTLINLLGLHVISKCFIFYPAYIFNVDAPRTLAHVIATSSVINVAMRLAKKPLI